MAEHKPLDQLQALAEQVIELSRDEWLLALAKPSGVAAHRGWARDPVTLVDVARKLVGCKVHLVQRLDRGASGVSLFALDPETAAQLGQAYAEGRTRKRYLALVRGIAPEAALVQRPLPTHSGGERMPASTEIRRLAFVDAQPRALSLVEVIPHQGHLHQVRRHLNGISHPLIGDANHGESRLNRQIQENYGFARLGLHALSLVLTHPRTSETLELSTPLPEDFTGPLVKMGFDPDVWRVTLADTSWQSRPAPEQTIVGGIR